MVARGPSRDSGYGWVIVFAFFLMEVLVDGVRFSFGLFFVEFLSEFGKGKADTAWIGGIMIGVYNLSGFGYGLAFLAGTVAVGKYFYKRRALAIGISFCGSGVGTFVIPPLVRLLVEIYTWRGTMFILAGMALNGCVLAALYRPIEDENDIIVDEVKGKKPRIEDSRNGLQTHCENDIVMKRNGHISNGTQSPLLYAEKRLDQNGIVDSKKDLRQTKMAAFDDLRKERFKTLADGTDHGSYRSLNMSVLSQSILGSNASFEYIFDKRSHKMSNLTLRARSVTSVKTAMDDSGTEFKYSVIEDVFPRALVTNINFIIMMISSAFIGLTSFVPFSMLPDFAMSVGASPLQGAWLLSTLGIGGTVSRVGAGILSDLPCVHRLTLNGVCFLIIGVTTTIAALVPLYEVLITYSTLFGIFYGAIYVVQPIVLLEYFGEQYISEVMGIMMCVYGVSSLIGSPLAGWIFDFTGSYQVSFLTSGFSFFFGGVINFFVLCTKPSREARRLIKLELKVDNVEDI
ncbi:monocarboxylate transporter 12-like isoform X2 [Mercenaria mercenaria]|uniref:monocarboxylate transporter 12-like isoform X2 n=1 Tax=Mercenaria mercenaria TaxID=6596 RepID=UPI00234F3169|nr:monocarboxylate transporter 12-like isoform X2 [Mercenaria mercenaria]